MATMQQRFRILLAIPLVFLVFHLMSRPAVARGGGHGGGHGGGGFHGGGGHIGGGFHGGGFHGGGFHGGGFRGAPAVIHGGGFRGGGFAGGGFRGAPPRIYGGGFRGGYGGMGVMRPGFGGVARAPSMGLPRSFGPSMGLPRSFGQPGLARGLGPTAAIRPGSIAPGRGLGMARSPYGIGARAPVGSAAGMARNPYGLGARPPITPTAGLAARNPYGLGARAPINSAAHLGALSGAGRLGIGNRAGAGINPASFNRAALSNRSVAISRTSNTLNTFNTRSLINQGNWGWRNNAYAGLHQNWLHGRWGGFGRGYGYGRYGFGRGYGYGRYGYGFYPGFGYGFYPGFGYGFYPGFGYGGFGYGLGYGLGLGLGFGLGYGALGLGYGLFGLGGLGYGLGYGGLGYGLGLGYGGLGYGYPFYGGYGYGYPFWWYSYPSYGYGLTSWMYGPSLYDWGYASYYNPYHSSYGYSVPATIVGEQSVVYDYSQPINTQAPAPEPAVANQAVTSFDAARAAFKAGDYSRALELTDEAIRLMPNDAALHEFRALVLFALQRYDEAAAALYAVLTAGPGWDWATLSSLYPNVSVYTQQLRALETYCTQHTDSASARFVLAYHYLTAGHTLAALQQLQQVAALQPRDTLAPQLARQLGSTAPAPSGSAPVPPAAPPLRETSALAPAAPPPGREGRLEGTWTAQPDQDTTIVLSFPDPGHFTWKVTHQGQSRQLQGKLTYGNGLLTLAQDQGTPMVGNLTWADERHFTFKVPGAAPDDPGLTFTKSS